MIEPAESDAIIEIARMLIDLSKSAAPTLVRCRGD